VRFDDDTDDEDTPTVINPGEIASRQTPRESAESTGKESVNEDALFIPLSWSRLQKGELYATSDPEWQAFVMLSKDRKKLQALRGEQSILCSVGRHELTCLDELANIVLEGAGSQMSQILGDPLSLTGFWLVHQFPTRAPPGYVRSGYVLADFRSLSW